MSENDTAWLAGSGLIELEPGPMPIIPKPLWAEIELWILSWKHADALAEEGLEAPGALLLHGPTGSGKTSLARGVLKYMQGRVGCIMEAHNIVDSHFGQSEKNLAKGFHLAEYHGAMLVIEEIDALGMSRSRSDHEATTRITIAMMRCLEAAKIPVIATTNFKAHLDPALLRRFETQIEVPALDEKGRTHVLKKILGKEPEPELVAMPLNESIRIARRMRRVDFLASLEGKA